MYTKSVMVDKVSEKDREGFSKELPMVRAINLPVSDEMIARWKAVRMVNSTLPTQECVMRVSSSVFDGEGYVMRLEILD